MRKSRHLPDLLNAAAAFGIAIALALFFHTKWHYGGWMTLFGDPPAANPAYDHFVQLFEAAPYVAAGLGAGLISGFGYPQLSRILIRFGGVVILFLLSLTSNSHLAVFAFAPVSVGSFFVSTGLSLLYFRLLTHSPNWPTAQVKQESRAAAREH